MLGQMDCICPSLFFSLLSLRRPLASSSLLPFHMEHLLSYDMLGTLLHAGDTTVRKIQSSAGGNGESEGSLVTTLLADRAAFWGASSQAG